MKKTYIAMLLGLLILSSCGSEETVESLRASLAEKEAAQDKLEEEIKEIEEKLAILEGDSLKVASKLVEIAKVEQGLFSSYIEVQGVAESDENVLISPEIGGVVKQIKVKEGQTVKAGQELVVLDASAINKQIAEINTSLSLAITVFKKQEALWKKKIGTELQYLQAKNNKEALESKLATAQTQLSKMVLKAPISGIIDQTVVNEGEIASPGRPVLRIVNLSQIKLKAEVSERYVTNFKQGDSVTVFFPSINLEKRATISQVGQVIDPTNRTFSVQASISNDNAQLKANLLGLIRFVDYENPSALSIPSVLVQQNRGEKYVYKMVKNEDGDTIATKLVIEPGASFKGRTEIIKGLSGDDFIISKGSKTVKDGQRISVKPSNKD